MCRYVIFFSCFCVAMVAVPPSVDGQPPPRGPDEPNAEVASQWWPEFENVWTPIGWKDHFLRFNVLYDGTVIAEPRKAPYIGQGVQLTFIPTLAGETPGAAASREPYCLAQRDGGVGHQGWRDTETPVLWSEWREAGLIFRQEMFAHVAGAGPVQTAVEPLYAWIRLSVRPVDGQTEPDRCAWRVKVNKPHVRRSMTRQENLRVHPADSAYPRPLHPESPEDGPRRNLLLLEKQARVRLGVAPTPDGSVRFVDHRPAGTDTVLHIEMPVRRDARVDLLVPMVPDERAAFDAEFALGFDRALAESERFWSRTPATAARVVTPEKTINEAIRRCLKLAEVIAMRHPQTRQYCLLSGSWHYEALWATPTSMMHTMVLDPMGYHPLVEKYLDVFREEQGKRVPPGDGYRPHSGYLSSPKFLASIDWLSDHGAILYAVCHHALLTEDQQFIDRWVDTVVRACEFIKDSRAVTGHGGIEGILPPAVATDRRLQTQAVWNDGWNYKGLTAAARLLERIGHPRADEFTQEARAYKAAFGRAIREAAQGTPQWVDAGGSSHRLVPTALPDGGDTTHPFYLDTGPLFLVYAGLLDADDELMRSALLYFREGPNRAEYDLNGAWDQPISLHREISSCEPCYSWNLFHSHQSGDRYRFLEGMYSMMLGTLSRQTYIGCEHRGGISGTLFSAPLGIYAVRLSVIDDQIEPGRLHLLRLVPRAWLSGDRPTTFERIPTEFGPVTLRFQLEDNARRLRVNFQPQFRRKPQAIFVHIPPSEGLRAVSVNGTVSDVEPGDVIALK